MSSTLDELEVAFGADVSAEAMQAAIEVLEISIETGLEEECSHPGILFYDLETLPDESRFPAPVSMAPAGLSKSVEDILKQTVPDIEKDIDAATDEQLIDLRTAESMAKKPRSGVTSMIDKIIKERVTGFDKWIKAHSVDPFSCKICCLAWAVGSGQVRSLTAHSIETEKMLLQIFWKLVQKDGANGNEIRTRCGFGITRFDDMVIITRSIALRVEIPVRLDLRKYGNKQAIDLEQFCFPNSQTVACKTLARAWGIDIPVEDMDGSQVYALAQAGEWDRIGEYGRSDVTVEREIFRKAIEVFA